MSRIRRVLQSAGSRRLHSTSLASGIRSNHVSLNNMAYNFRNSSLFHSSSRRFSDAKPDTAAASEGSEADSEDKEASTEGESVEEEGESAESQIEALNKEIKDLKNQVLLSLAEQDNVRRIARKDVENARSYGVTKFAKALLDVSDNFERALEAVPEETKESLKANTDADGDLKLFAGLVEGIVAVEKDMQKTFNQFGVKKYGEAGDTFDPEIHDALFEIPDGSKEAGTIGQVVKVGYKLKDRVLRAAQVGTYKKP